jgi:hypothetical protein
VIPPALRRRNRRRLKRRNRRPRSIDATDQIRCAPMLLKLDDTGDTLSRTGCMPTARQACH